MLALDADAGSGADAGTSASADADAGVDAYAGTDAARFHHRLSLGLGFGLRG